MIRNVMTVIFATITVVLIFAWLLTYFWMADGKLYFDGRKKAWHLSAHNGQARVDFLSFKEGYFLAKQYDSYFHLKPNPAPAWAPWWRRFVYATMPSSAPMYQSQIQGPLWLPTLIFAACTYICFAPVLLLRRRRRKGLCVHCGYNLTGNTSGTCPECGEKA